ncbi:MAG: hypothetical protein ABII82_07340 [Verrucomicrobiota bacterium]
MIVRFLKNPPAARADHLTCTRADGTTWETELPRAGVLPLLAMRHVIESSLGLKQGWFGSVARSGEPDDRSDDARISLILAHLTQAEQWGGASTPDVFRQKLAAACADAGLPAPDITDRQLADLRADLRAFGALWRPLNAGQYHETTW